MFREMKPEKYWEKHISKTQKKQFGIKDEVFKRIMSNEYIGSLKKDGEYNRFIIEDGRATMTGRGVSTVTGTYVDNTEKIPSIMNELTQMFSEGTCILGEIYMPNKTSNEVRKVMGCNPTKAIARQKETPVYYYIFDAWSINGKSLMNTSAIDRFLLLEQVRKVVNKTKFIQMANFYFEPNKIMDLIGWAFENNEEGVVLVRRDGFPEPGKRTSWKTMKVKKEFASDIDCFFTGTARPPERLYSGKTIEDWSYWENTKTGEKIKGKKYKDYLMGETLEPVTRPYFFNWPGALEIALVKDNNEIFSLGYVSSGLNDQIKQRFADNPKDFIKLPARVQGMEFTGKAIRHPKLLEIREDTISWEDCTYRKVFDKDGK